MFFVCGDVNQSSAVLNPRGVGQYQSMGHLVPGQHKEKIADITSFYFLCETEQCFENYRILLFSSICDSILTHVYYYI